MVLRNQELTTAQIEQWMKEGAERVSPATVEAQVTNGAGNTAFDFKKARQALQRARTKTSLRTVKPLRRLRTNQAAVNESLMDALSAMLAVNKAMATELNALSAELAELRGRLTQRRND